MGLFDQIKTAYAGAYTPQRADSAGRAADAIMREHGFADGIAAVAGMRPGDAATGIADRSAMEDQAREQNRILRVGEAVQLTIVGRTDTGEQVAGNPVWLLDLEVRHADGRTRGARLRQIVSSAALAGYAIGTTAVGRVDPADPAALAFGDQPWM